MHVVIPMAGLGSRFKDAGYTTHKPLIQVNGKTLIEYTVESLNIDGKYIFVVRDYGNNYVKDIKNVLGSMGVDNEVIVLDRLTTGAAETALVGIKKYTEKTNEHIENELVITNCDQFLEWDSEAFLSEAKRHPGAVLTYKSDNPKNSFVEIVNGKVVQIVEKKAISDQALVGVHYWREASEFVQSAEKSLRLHDGTRETFVSETYNHVLKDNREVAAIPIEPGRYHCTGTPEDLALFKGFILEYFTPKAKTYFIDLDGTIFMHAHKYSNLTNKVELCPHVKQALDEIDSRGDKIILVSARKESARRITEKILDEHLVPYDQLILGVSQGQRIVVNDKLTPESASRCGSRDVITDKGWMLEDVD